LLRAIRFFFYSNLYVGCLAASLAWVNSSILNAAVPWTEELLFIFSATLIVYLLDRLMDIRVDSKVKPERTRFTLNNRPLIILLLVLAVLGSSFTIVRLPARFIETALLLSVLTGLYLFFYNIVDKKNGKFHNIKIFTILKPLWLSIVWVLVTLYLPFAGAKNIATFPTQLILLGLVRFGQYGIDGVLFDLRDLRNSDSPQSTHSGDVNSYKTIVVALCVITFGVLFFAIATKLLPPVFLTEAIIPSVYILFIFKTSWLKKPVPELLYPALLDGILFLPVLVYLLKPYTIDFNIQ